MYCTYSDKRYTGACMLIVICTVQKFAPVAGHLPPGKPFYLLYILAFLIEFLWSKRLWNTSQVNKF